ncbi:MAG TPA: tRNA pseudouridine(55) synthase TruB [Acidimicrobiales bacterium]
MARRRDTGPDGIAVIDKEAGWTSHDVVAKARGMLRTRRIGHAGTLDPDATGVLVLGVGSATRLLRYCTALPKSYVAEIVFGVATTTLDASGDVVATADMRALTPEDVKAAARRFVGEILQVPPMVSAVRVGGRRLHELAREGKDVERAPRPVTVHRFDLEPIEHEPSRPHPVYRAEVDCSSGTYVRTLAADLGEALGGHAHLRALRRTAVGPFTLADARPLEQLDATALLAPEAAVAGLGAVVVDDELAALVRNGRVLPASRLGAEGPPPWAVFDRTGALLAVYQPHRHDQVKPEMVLARDPADPGAQGHPAPRQ